MIKHCLMGALVAGCLVGIVGCPGPAVLDDGGVDSGGPLVDSGPGCATASDGTPCGVQQICVSHSCQTSACGDGYLNTAGGEQCEDGNTIPGDGCEPSTCQFTCADSTGCDDQNVCTGVEECLAAHTCSNPADLTCDDSNPCTADSCDALAGCRHTLIDVDGDGFAALSLGACGAGTAGGDCNDNDNTTYPGAHDGCDPGHIDNNCNGTSDEDGNSHYYADCDADGYAAVGAAMMDACDVPPSGPAACSGGSWTVNAPLGSALVDCNDSSGAVHPGAAEMVGDSVDSNCDGVETCYRDRDGDHYRTDETIESSNTTCTDSGEGLATDPLEWPLSPSSARDICCDQNAQVHDGVTDWFNVNNVGPIGNVACPSGRRWDYDCNGVETQRYTDILTQCFWEPAGCSRGGDTDTQGWYSTGVPSCGNPGTVWDANCHGTGPTSCDFDRTVMAQDCH